MLNILEGYDLGKLGPGAESLHLMIEAMKRAYADRAVFLGDPDSVKIPLAGLTVETIRRTLARADRRRAPRLRPTSAPASRRLRKAATPRISRSSTATATRCPTPTRSISPTALGLVADGTGVLLNNELDDFTAKPGAANAYGLVGFDTNLPGPDKRPLSSMTPTIVLKDGKPVLVTGSPGGSRIITAVLQVIVNVIDFRMPLARAVDAPRLHHQWQPDQVFVEPGFAPAVLAALKSRGHAIVPTEPHTSANSIAVTAGGYVGVADTRTRGALAAGY